MGTISSKSKRPLCHKSTSDPQKGAIGVRRLLMTLRAFGSSSRGPFQKLPIQVRMVDADKRAGNRIALLL
jgi:hypothetical protein